MRDYADQIARLRECASNSHEVHLKCGAYLSGVCAKTRDIRMQEAADAIEELLAKVPHWISVEERLPDHRKRVLAIYANGVISTGRVFHNGFPEAYDGFDENGDFKAVPVTHWMPLPATPEGVE